MPPVGGSPLGGWENWDLAPYTVTGNTGVRANRNHTTGGSQSWGAGDDSDAVHKFDTTSLSGILVNDAWIYIHGPGPPDPMNVATF